MMVKAVKLQPLGIFLSITKVFGSQGNISLCGNVIMSEMFLMFMYDVLLDDIMIVNSEPIFFFCESTVRASYIIDLYLIVQVILLLTVNACHISKKSGQ